MAWPEGRMNEWWSRVTALLFGHVSEPQLRQRHPLAGIPGTAEHLGRLFRYPHRSGDRAGPGGEGGRSRGAAAGRAPAAAAEASNDSTRSALTASKSK